MSLRVFNGKQNNTQHKLEQNDMNPPEGTIALNNYLQLKDKAASLSWQDTSSGPAHAPEWESVCKIDGVVIASGRGTHKHLARDVAATEALAILQAQDAA
ncbi:hypothetical protein BV25DRAFT_1911054 [Artomyces pyxidatus]|uniref:Uncharacterized protein n=1 Tax=Artomyces pyxidatus TaxID=48021 RepID=A0ACB8THX6_9AGAM|nr:hypothetical protein BV25DRAFT_1911054 [Artomyces pyxidatus]